MAMQFTCPFCHKSQLRPDLAAGQALVCAHCRKVVKVAGAAPAAVPLARPVPQAAPAAIVARARRRSGSSVVVYVVVAVSVATMATGVTLAVLYWPGREEPRLPIAKMPPKVEPPKADKNETKPLPMKKVAEPPEPEPEPDAEPPPALLTQKMGEWYVEGEQAKVRLDFHALEPSTVIKELKVLVWTGEVAAPRPATWRARPVRRGESPRQEVRVEFKAGRGSAEVPLPVLPKDKVYWLQPVLVDGDGKAQWLATEPWEPATPPLERRPALLTHRLEAGSRSAQLSSQGKVTVRDGTGKAFDFTIGVQGEIDETVNSDGGLLVRYTRVGYELTRDNIPWSGSKEFDAALDAKSKISTRWQLDPTGTVDKRVVKLDDVSEIARKLVPEYDDRLAQAFALANLHLPNRELQAMESWKHHRAWGKAILVLTATYEGRRFHQKRDEAYLTLRGTLKEVGKEKVSTVEGMALVELRGGYVMKADLKVETEIVVPVVGLGMIVQGPGVLEVRLTRDVVK